MTGAKIVGTVVAFLLVPVQSLGQDSWKIAAALMGSYIGGGSLLRNFLLHLIFTELDQQKYALIYGCMHLKILVTRNKVIGIQ